MHPKAVLDPKRRKKITDGLKDYSVEDLCKSLNGYSKSKWHSDRSLNELTLLLRDVAHIEAGIVLDDVPPKPRSRTADEIEADEVAATIRENPTITDQEIAAKLHVYPQRVSRIRKLAEKRLLESARL